MEKFSSSKSAKVKSAPRQQLKNSQFALQLTEVRKVIYACDNPRDRTLVAALAATGMRRAEVAALDVRDVDLEARRVTIRSGKGGKQRTVPITEELASDLRLLIGKRATGPVFLSNRRGPLTTRQVNYIVADAGVRAGVKNPNPASHGRITCHLFRHTFARHWKQRGGDIESLAQILGHASSATTVDLYGTLSIDDVQEHYDRLMETTS
ncbi:MAG: tyrosine-type recombinase/integrase [Candidatus Eisenbacteria bacterium]|nr:tyrosine-type recombinase/integrase [Candidatus Eisenbacteria bacterium]